MRALLLCFLSFRYKLNRKISLLLICELLGLFVKTLTPNDKYSLRNSEENLLQPIQMQSSKKQKTFSEFFDPVLKSALSFKHFEKKVTFMGYVFPKLQAAKDVVR